MRHTTFGMSDKFIKRFESKRTNRNIYAIQNARSGEYTRTYYYSHTKIRIHHFLKPVSIARYNEICPLFLSGICIK